MIKRKLYLKNCPPHHQQYYDKTGAFELRPKMIFFPSCVRGFLITQPSCVHDFVNKSELHHHYICFPFYFYRLKTVIYTKSMVKNIHIFDIDVPKNDFIIFV